MKKSLIVAALLTSLVGITAQAADVEAGKAKAKICAACHGADGKAVIDGYPNLNGQNAKYIVSSLKAYKAKQRNGGLAAVMQAQASMLSDQDMENLGAYYSSMK
ncbi:c-type cytochrome [Vibrio comitans]|uniref:Cytochrome c biogenesis protein CcsB n=1 Tax=Vibrio comitans NBRC 102076 TaxID=1219078 RepID=A0A4Y3IL93_9VIBR|nr:cytochrome c [Vibrio comitans]GEA59524.1 cytochrome c biogenesis protein CcsB [Vibrio comitans NBRC 102076]